MSYKLYRVINMINQKSYIGITELSLKNRWKIHISDSKDPVYPFHRAIKKYGFENFSIFLLKESCIREEISSLEDPAIILYKSHITENGYNVARGGYGGNLGDEANQKRRLTRSKFSPEKKKLISEKLSKSQKGLKRSVEQKAKMSVLQKDRGGYGPSTHTEETCIKISKGNSEKIRSEKAKENYSRSAKLRGTGPQLQGKKISCMCCKKSWDLGNFSQHIRRNNNES